MKQREVCTVDWVLSLIRLYCFIIPIARLNHDRIGRPLSAPAAGRDSDSDTVRDRLYPASALGAFIQWCSATQITLHRYLVMYLLQLNNHQYSGGFWLLTGAFLYGVLHAIGPGHGKFIVTTYLSTNKESLLAARVVPFVGSLMQGVSAIDLCLSSRLALTRIR